MMTAHAPVDEVMGPGMTPLIPRARLWLHSTRGYLLPTKATRVGPGSGVVPGGTLFLRLPAVGERGSSMACGLAGHRGEAWLKRGLLGS